MPRQARLDAPGTLHHIIVRGIEKRRIVDDDSDREGFVTRTGDLATETGTRIYAWALMSNHAHLLLRSGKDGLPDFMRRLLTGHAVSYNRRHSRHGHLFQNRYKSIVCEEDAYFKQLIRYIHLNPIRAGLVKNMAELERYRWCGHAVLMGRVRNGWQDRDYVLSWFGANKGEAKQVYRRYVEEALGDGRRPELVGGGLVRSKGGWSDVVSMRRLGLTEQSDERILGSGDFVNEIVQEADVSLRQRFTDGKNSEIIEQFIQERCRTEGVNIEEVRSGSRRSEVSKLRREIAMVLLEKYGVPLADIARRVGVTTSAISKMLRRSGSGRQFNKVNNVPQMFIDCDSDEVQRYAREVTAGMTSPRAKAVSLYYAVRDGISYDPYSIELTREAFRASTILKKGSGYCVAKAIVLAALCRACDIPCRLHFADVRNHLTTRRLREMMQTDTFYYHGYNDIYLDGRWLKVTPTFNISLCEKFKIKPLDWDGTSDAVFHPYDMEGRRHMEYIRDRGSYDDVPYDELIEMLQRCYPAVVSQAKDAQAGAFEREGQEESGSSSSPDATDAK